MSSDLPLGADSLIYARVSTEEQAKKDFSIPRQFTQCRQYAARHGFVVALELSDDETGAILERPNIERIRDLIKTRAIKRVIVWRQDRIARDELGYFTLRAEFKRFGVELHAVNRGGPVGGLYASLEAVLDADERTRITERTSTGRREKAKRGKIVGNGPPPFGYTRTGAGENIAWQIDPESAHTVRLIFHLYTAEQLSADRIAVRLTELGRPTPSDRRPEVRRKRGPGQWTRETVRWTLRNPAYTGVWFAYRTEQPKGDRPKKRPPKQIRNPSEWIPIAIPQIVEPEVFEQAQARLAQAQALGFRNTKAEYLVGRRIRCSCGRSATGRASSLSGYNKTRHFYYTCRSRHQSAADRGTGEPCDMPIFRAADVDAAVWKWVREEVLDRKALRIGLDEYDQAQARARGPATDPRVERETRRQALIEQRDRINFAFMQGVMTFGEYQPLKRGLDQQIAEIERFLLITTTTEPKPPSRASRTAALLLVETIIDEYGRELDEATYPTKRFIIDQLNIRVTLRHVDGQKKILIRSEPLDLEAERSP